MIDLLQIDDFKNPMLMNHTVQIAKKKNKAGHILKFIKQLIAQKQKTNRIWSTSSNEYLPK